MTTIGIDKKAKQIQREVQKSSDALIAALRLRDQLQLPMVYILQHIPGENVTQQCKFLNISRQTWYSWLRGATRPTEAQAKRLAAITGFHVSQIRCSATAQAEAMLATLTRS